MKAKEKKELRLKSLKELNNLADLAKDTLMALRMDKTQNKLKNTRSISLKRKEISIILTLIREKELQGEMEAKNEKTGK